MTSLVDSQLIQDAIGLIVLIGGTLAYTKSRIPQQTIKNLEALAQTYEKRIRALEDELKENHKQQLTNVASIADLQGQVKVYKELPLQELADGIKQNNSISIEILNELRKTAVIAAEDRDVLTNQNVHIKTEVEKIIHPKPVPGDRRKT